MAQKNSFISLLEQIAQMNKNSVEIITKLNDVVGSNKNTISVDYQMENGVTQFELPTVGWLKKEIDIANSNIKKLSSLESDSSVIIIDENDRSKKIKSVDMNREPSRISNIDIPNNFHQSNNWFFESLINPLLNVEIDLDGKISENVNKILSRRYILRFEKDSEGDLTTAGQDSFNTFESRFLNQNNFSIQDFQDWLNLETNTGILNKGNINSYMDEQYFDLNYKEIVYKGYFTVNKLWTDNINQKSWYYLNTLSYYDRNGGEKTLAIGDILSITNNQSKYRVVEIDVSESSPRVVLERIEGYDPVPVGITSGLEYYSTLISQKKVNISVGFEEYNVLFVRSINTENNIISSNWSKGMAFFTSNLLLDTDSNVDMVQFYIDSVRDYGLLLKDQVSKKIPSALGVKPNKPELVSDNFKVVQINKHLTDTKNHKSIREVNSQKTAVKSKISQIHAAIESISKKKNGKFLSAGEKLTIQSEEDKLRKDYSIYTEEYTSYVNQITNSVVEASTEPKFHLRGFFDIPDPIIKNTLKPQEVIGFEIQYRYGSKLGGTDNVTEGFELKSNVLTTDTNTFKKKTAYFSQWNSIKSPIRKRTYDAETNQWLWETENLSDADIPNINQVSIPIQKNERVEFRVRSLSEVGYPETPIYSDWSIIITKEFPDELNNILGENQFILKEAIQEEMLLSFEGELETKGINKHVKDSYFVNETYYAHIDKAISTSFKDSFGNPLSLFDYLKMLNDKVTALEESIKRSKGELRVTLYNGSKETVISNNANIINRVYCQEYMTELSSSTYLNKEFGNEIYIINDFYIEVENIAIENELSLLTSTIVDDFDFADDKCPSFVNQENILTRQEDNQWIYLLDKATINGAVKTLYSGDIDTITQNDLNWTAFGDTGTTQEKNVLVDLHWETNGGNFGATIHPHFITESTNTTPLQDAGENLLHIIEPKSVEKIPINIYFKPSCDTTTIFTSSVSDNDVRLSKTIKFRLELENKSRPFEFTLTFDLWRTNHFTNAERQQNFNNFS